MSGTSTSITLVGTAALLIVGHAAGESPSPASRDAIPEQMPFDVPYGTPITLERAEAAISAAVAEARKRNWKMNVAVVDSGGNLVAFQRMDGAQLASIQVAEHKARAAAIFRRETKVWEDAMASGANYVLTVDGVQATRGGLPLIEQGKLIGAIGCSGGASPQDEVVCKAGAATVRQTPVQRASVPTR